MAASWEKGCHVVVDPDVPATKKGRLTKEPLLFCRSLVGALLTNPFALTCYCGSDTRTGVLLSVVVPSPSWPLPLNPQQ